MQFSGHIKVSFTIELTVTKLSLTKSKFCRVGGKTGRQVSTNWWFNFWFNTIYSKNFAGILKVEIKTLTIKGTSSNRGGIQLPLKTICL